MNELAHNSKKLRSFHLFAGAGGGNRGEERSILSPAGSLAKTSAQQEKGPESTGSDPGYGEKWQELLVKYDRNSSSWKTHRDLWEEVLPWSSVTLPRWGMMRSGVCWELIKPARFTSGIGAGSSPRFPTPTASDSKGGSYSNYWKKHHRDKLKYFVTPEYSTGTFYPNPSLSAALMGFPISWTSLKPLEMDKFHKWLHSHGEF